MTEEQEYEVVHWDEMYQLCLDLADRIVASGRRFDIILGISRGGLVPARIMSDELDNQNVAVVKVEFYIDVGKTEAEPRVAQVPDLDLRDKDVLVVDDVADSGRSLERVSSLLKSRGVKSLAVATLFYKPWSVTIPDFFVKTTRKWIVFPHERREAILAIAKRMRSEGVENIRQKLIDKGFEPALVDRATRRAATPA